MRFSARLFRGVRPDPVEIGRTVRCRPNGHGRASAVEAQRQDRGPEGGQRSLDEGEDFAAPVGIVQFDDQIDFVEGKRGADYAAS